MLGKDIAANLREHRDLWTQTVFLNKYGRYCVLGLKAHEAGIRDDTLMKMGNSYATNPNSYPLLADVWKINDDALILDSVIESFEDRGDEDFPGVEEFIEICHVYEQEGKMPTQSKHGLRSRPSWDTPRP